MFQRNQPWIIEGSTYWRYNLEACVKHFPELKNLQNTEDIVEYMESTGKTEEWFTGKAPSIGAYVFQHENRWSIFERLVEKNRSIEMIILAAAECARFDPKKTWELFKKHIPDAEHVLVHQMEVLQGQLYKDNDDSKSVLEFHPGIQALIAASKNPENIRVWMAHAVSLDKEKVHDFSDVHLLKTTQKIFDHYGQKEVFDRLLNEHTNILLEQGIWGLQWLLHGDKLFEDFPNADDIKRTLYNMNPQIHWNIEKPYMLTQAPRLGNSGKEKNESDSYFQYNYPGFDRYIQRWVEFLQREDPSKIHELLFQKKSGLIKPTTAVLWRELKDKFQDTHVTTLLVFEALQTAITMSTSQRQQFFRDATYLTCDLDLQDGTSPPIHYAMEDLRKWGYILDPQRWREIATQIWNNPYALQIAEAIQSRVEDPNLENKRWIDDIQRTYANHPEKQLGKYLLVRMLGDPAAIKEEHFQQWFSVLGIHKELGIAANLFETWKEITSPEMAASHLDILQTL